MNDNWRPCVEENPIAIRVHNHRGEILVAACDETLVGKTFEEGELQLQVHKAFYDDFRIDEKGLLHQLKISTIANLVGKKTIKCVMDAGLVTKDSVIHIQGIPHVQIFRMI